MVMVMVMVTAVMAVMVTAAVMVTVTVVVTVMVMVMVTVTVTGVMVMVMIELCMRTEDLLYVLCHVTNLVRIPTVPILIDFVGLVLLACYILYNARNPIGTYLLHSTSNQFDIRGRQAGRTLARAPDVGAAVGRGRDGRT